MTGLENETSSEEKQACQIERLSDDILRLIFAFIDIEDRFLYLETVSKRWMNIMPYGDWIDIDLSKIHQHFCRLGRFCQFEASKRYPSSYRKSLYSWLWKALNSLIGRCSHVVRSLDMSGLAINDDIVQLLTHFPKLEHVNVTKCIFTSSSENWLLQVPLKSLTIHGTEVNTNIIERINAESLKISENFESNSFQDLRCLVSLTVSHSSITYSNLDHIFQKCTNLESFAADSFHEITPFCAQTMKTSVAGRLKTMSLSMHTQTLFPMLEYFSNLSELSLQTPKNQQQIVYLEPLLSLSNLKILVLRCNKMSENDIMTFVLRSNRLQLLEFKSKKLYSDSNNLLNALVPSIPLNLQVLKLSLVSIFESTRVAKNIIPFSPRLNKIKLMKRKVKASFLSAHSIYRNCSEFEDYYKIVLGLSSLQSLTIPYITSENFTMLMKRFKDMSLKKLIIYGGYVNMDKLRPIENVTRTLVSLQCGPYVKISGLEHFLCQLPNLQKFSFHIHTTCSWNVLRAIGKHPKLNRVDLRSCDDYFFEHIHFELSTLITSRRQMKTVHNFVLFKPIFINAWSSLRHLSLPSKTEQILDDLLIRFRFLFDSN